MKSAQTIKEICEKRKIDTRIVRGTCEIAIKDFTRRGKTKQAEEIKKQAEDIFREE
jgi:hypothetical protein